ncbi:hypothetical protein BGL41_04565 [Fructilactobacillus sanfranciscensis]|uniref:hypothetical protein n=1 Tax=Fructilactobacillus sanfranciscensis TaxID=1625 RepID=UPI000CD41DFE|nr:hypothetical protein [Fructilactobacillus sanfranciscensis]POH13399.1 hypothetical protein BGL41_04565 [Fructilactobacillus sanfranciscensis]
MSKDRGKGRWLDGSELLIYLHGEGIDYNPYAETFNNMAKRLGLRSFGYSNKRRYLKEDVDLAIKKI